MVENLPIMLARSRRIRVVSPPCRVNTVDFGKTASDYRTHRAGFPPETFDRLEGLGVGLAGQKIVDLGTGDRLGGPGFGRAWAPMLPVWTYPPDS